MGDSPIQPFRWPVAAFDGLRLVLRRPWVVAAWGLLVALVLCGCALIGRFGIRLLWDAGLIGGGNVPFLAIVLAPVLAGSGALVMCAAYRAVLTPDDSRFAYLRFGAAEARMTALYLAMLCALTALFGIANLIGSWGFLLLVAGFAAAVRTSLLGPAFYYDGRFNFAGGWRLGGEWFWNLLGMHVILLVVGLIGAGVAWWAWTVLSATLGAILVDEVQSWVQWARLFAVYVLFLVVCTTIFVMLGAPAVVVYREVAGEPDTDAEPIAETFS